MAGLGGSGTNDGGAGMLAALGATSTSALDAAAPAYGIADVDLAAARAAIGEVRLVAASDVESPLTGLFGATKTFGPQKGIPEERSPVVDGWLEVGRAVDRPLSLEKGRAPPVGSASRSWRSARPASRGSTW